MKETTGHIETIEELILDVLYENRTYNFTRDGLFDKISKKREISDQDTLIKNIKEALVKLSDEGYIGSRREISRVVPGDWGSPATAIIFFYITEKGILRVLNKDNERKKIQLSDHDKSIQELVAKADIYSRDAEQSGKKITDLKNEIDKKFNEVEKIRNEFEQVRKDFYTKILEIFGIFVAIFSFIIVGFSQSSFIVKAENSWTENFYNMLAVFIPLTVVLIILIAGIGIIIWLATKKR